MPVPTDVDLSIIGAFMSTLLFGAYLYVAFQCFELLYQRYRTKHQVHIYLFATHVILFILICVRCIAVLHRTVSGIVNRSSDGIFDFGKLASPISLTVNVPWMMSIVVSDIFIVYRAYIVTKKRLLLIAFPIALVIADTAMGIWLIYCLTQITDDSTFFASQLATATKCFCSFTVATNIACSGLIAWHIISVQRGVAGFAVKNDTLTSLVATIIESAAIWTVVSLAIVITTFLGSYVNYVLIDLCPPLIGIVFSNIIIRISRGQSYGDTNTNTNTGARRDWSGRVGDRDAVTDVQIRLDRIVHTTSHGPTDEFQSSKMDVVQDSGSSEIYTGTGSKALGA